MTTANDVIQDALEMLGIYGPGDTISAADQSRMFFLLNAMLDEFASMNIFLYQITPLTLTLVASQAAYTIGPSGASVTAIRPTQITYGEAAATVTGGSTTTFMDVVSAVEFQALKSYGATPSRPQYAWYNPTFPSGTVTLLPAPDSVGTAVVNAWYRLARFDTQTDDYTFAVGVLDGLRDNLAVSAKPYFTNAALDPIITARAAVARDFLRYQGQTSRAMFNRFALTSNPQKVA